MKVLLDANVLISILLAKSTPSPIVTIAQALSIGLFTPVVSEATLEELTSAVEKKPYLSSRITSDMVDNLVNVLKQADGIVPAIRGTNESLLRDAKDDYLIVTARAHNIDIIVSGDDDVLAHAGNEPFTILSPPAFVAALSLLADS